MAALPEHEELVKQLHAKNIILDASISNYPRRTLIEFYDRATDQMHPTRISIFADGQVHVYAESGNVRVPVDHVTMQRLMICHEFIRAQNEFMRERKEAKRD